MIKVAEILDSKTWGQGMPGLRGRSGTLCLMEATLTAETMALSGPARDVGVGHLQVMMLDAIQAVTGMRPSSATQWNDAPERTFAEVHAVACEIDRLRMLWGEA
mgnify:CR=1 FL=1